MTSEFHFYGLTFQELVLFGIILYVVALVLVVIFAQCIRYKTFCPFSGESVHCTYTNHCCRCPSCSLRQCDKSVFCCRRKHSIYYANLCETFPNCKINCFKPDCKYLRCCCCEFFIEGEQEKHSPQKQGLNKVAHI